MSESEYSVKVILDFFSMTLPEIHKLDLYLKGGLEGKEWGKVNVQINATSTGERVASEKTGKKVMTAKKLLEIEKEGVSAPSK